VTQDPFQSPSSLRRKPQLSTRARLYHSPSHVHTEFRWTVRLICGPSTQIESEIGPYIHGLRRLCRSVRPQSTRQSCGKPQNYRRFCPIAGLAMVRAHRQISYETAAWVRQRANSRDRGQAEIGPTKSLEQLPRPPSRNLPSGRCTSYCSPCFRASGRLHLAVSDHRLDRRPLVSAKGRSSTLSGRRGAVSRAAKDTKRDSGAPATLGNEPGCWVAIPETATAD
jgi:hypothetical protein